MTSRGPPAVPSQPTLWEWLQYQMPRGSISIYKCVFIAEIRGKNRKKTNDECVFLLKTRWTVSGQRKPNWLNWMNPTAVSTRSTSTLQSWLLFHREKSILCAIGTTLQINLSAVDFLPLSWNTFLTETGCTQCSSWKREHNIASVVKEFVTALGLCGYLEQQHITFEVSAQASNVWETRCCAHHLASQYWCLFQFVCIWVHILSFCSYSGFPVLNVELLEPLEGQHPPSAGMASRHTSPASPTAIFRRSKQVSHMRS